MVLEIKLFIDGQWTQGKGGESIDVINPATEETFAKLWLAGEAELEAALAAVHKGFAVWSRMPADGRAELLHGTANVMRERCSEMAGVLTSEQGKTLGQARGELLATAAYFDDLAECGLRIAGRLLPEEKSGVRRAIRYEPIGPVFAASPWNLPAMMPGRKIANTLAAGCSVIVKPARETPCTAALIAECCQEAGIPDGVVNVVSGSSSLISDTFIRSPVVRKISFTGSTPVGKELAALAGSCMKKATMELGGHAPVIVCGDVDVERAVDLLVPARYSNAGQSCMAATRFYVHDDIYDRFVEAFAERTRAIRMGDGSHDTTDMGPLINGRRVTEMAELVKDALSHDARLLCGGDTPPGRGYFYEPTVLADVPDTARIMQEEPFGPVTPFQWFATTEEVIQSANSTPYGLAAYVFGRDAQQTEEIACSLDAGLVGINTTHIAGPSVPFGGVRDSGLGREGTIEGVLESMVTKTVSRAG